MSHKSSGSVGIVRLESMTFYVHSLQRMRTLLCDQLDFAEIGYVGGPTDDEDVAVFSAGNANLIACAPRSANGEVGRYLSKHPEGVGTLTFEVHDIQAAFAALEQAGAAIINDVEQFAEAQGTLSMFSIATPLGGTTFRFVERHNCESLLPGFQRHSSSIGGTNLFGFGAIDHVTCNFVTMQPALLWMEHVLGFQRFWNVSFHTDDVSINVDEGSGLKSIVMWDPASGVKFACNEPLRPHFARSQIYLFTEDHRGDGIQHAALTVPNIINAVEGLRSRNVPFMPTPPSYFDLLPERLQRNGIGTIDESISRLRELEILVDGEGPQQYLLQIFLKEAAAIANDPVAGPFFFEIIQRRGSRGFGAGNFRALFESIEREQKQNRGGILSH